jgi:hypothetical protein
MNNWELENVEKKAKENPDQFFIPSTDERKNQKIGDIVRLHFILKEKGPGLPRAERMWVKIFEIDNKGNNFKGYLTSQPKYIKGLKADDVISFNIANIAQVIIKRTDPNWIECGEQAALVSNKCFDKGQIVRFPYREKPDREEDSGWRLFSGEESDEEVNDPANIRKCNVYWLSDWDPTLIGVLQKRKAGEAFDRRKKEHPWQMVEDWKPWELI